MMPEEQRETVELLSHPAAYGLAGGRVERIDTHISAVFLAGRRAYKMKRAVRLPFLDFTTLDRRKAACEAEVAVNRRISPELYLGLATVTREADGRLALGGAGAVVEWLVVMERFDEATLFDRMAEGHQLTREHMTELADIIARFHAAAEPRPQHGGRAGMSWTIANNAQCMAPYVPDIFAAGEVSALATESEAALAAVADLLERRRAAGMVRRCHGDLHLGNICIHDGRPTPFDAIEFSEPIACIDVVYDLAFLLMDLDQRGLRRLASIVFNRYLELTGDFGALPALPLFLSCRAGIRAHVAAATAGNLAPGQQEAKRREAAAYLARARGYLKPVAPRLVAIGGLSGTGKSRMGRELAPLIGPCPGAVVVRSDVMRKRLAGVAPETRLDADGYSAAMTERTYRALYDTVAAALAAGHAVIADAVFARPEQRRAVAEVAARAGVPFHGLWLEASPEVMRERVTSRKRNASDATADVVDAQLAYDLGEIDWARVDTSRNKGESLRAACTALGV